MFRTLVIPRSRLPRHLILGLALAMATASAPGALAGSAPPSTPAPAEWVQRSNANAQVLLDVMARLGPESASRFGVPGYDEAISDLTPGYEDRALAAGRKAVATLKERLAGEQDPLVKQDLEILIHAAEEHIEGAELDHKLVMPFFSATSTVFQGVRVLLDDQVAPERREAALVRLRRYAGMEKGYEPFAKLAEARIRERMAPGLLGPVKEEVEKELANSATYVAGIGKLFEKYQIEGYSQPYAELKKQLAAYDEFVKAEILPKARTDFRLPPELYAFRLKESGVDMPVPELMDRAQVAFQEIQNEMACLAPLVAKEKGWKLTDYRDVIRELKKNQVAGDAILPLYQRRIQDMERIIRDHKICTLPQRPMQVKLASEAESAAIPAPNMRPPRLIGNTGELGTFVLPLRIPGKSGQGKLEFDDFTDEAMSWPLTAHEGRPGHDLQFASVVEKGVSLARALFSFNSTNIEGWGLYAEAEAQPFEPLDGQLCTLQFRLLRAARAFLDPGLQTGAITKEEAARILRDEVMMSEAMTQQEVERYTFWAPAQAPAYFVGYSRLLEIREEAQRKLGPRFDRQRFNDFVLAQGMVPPSLLRQAVQEHFIPDQTASN